MPRHKGWVVNRLFFESVLEFGNECCALLGRKRIEIDLPPFYRGEFGGGRQAEKSSIRRAALKADEKVAVLGRHLADNIGDQCFARGH